MVARSRSKFDQLTGLIRIASGNPSKIWKRTPQDSRELTNELYHYETYIFWTINQLSSKTQSQLHQALCFLKNTGSFTWTIMEHFSALKKREIIFITLFTFRTESVAYPGEGEDERRVREDHGLALAPLADFKGPYAASDFSVFPIYLHLFWWKYLWKHVLNGKYFGQNFFISSPPFFYFAYFSNLVHFFSQEGGGTIGQSIYRCLKYS